MNGILPQANARHVARGDDPQLPWRAAKVGLSISSWRAPNER